MTMFKVDISKALPPSAFNYLAPFVPGLFFEISILLANPRLISELASQSQSAYHFGYYTLLLIALMLAFIIGNGFVLFVRMFQRMVGRIYQLKRFLLKQLNHHVLLPVVNRVMNRPGKIPPRWLVSFHRFLNMQDGFSPILMGVQRVYRLVAIQLLKKYGIVQPEWR